MQYARPLFNHGTFVVNSDSRVVKLVGRCLSFPLRKTYHGSGRLIRTVRAAADTGDVPLVPVGLPGCRYRMTFYDSAEVAGVDPAYGLQLHHPRFLKYVGAPESARLLTRTPEHWVHTMDMDVGVAAALQLQRGRGAHVLQSSGSGTICEFFELDVIRVDENGFWGRGVPIGCCERHFAGTPGIHRAAEYMAGMGLWRPPHGPGIPGPLPSTTYVTTSAVFRLFSGTNLNRHCQCLSCDPDGVFSFNVKWTFIFGI